MVNYYSYCTLGFDHTSWVWFICRHRSWVCVVLCTPRLLHTRLMTPVFLGELWVRLASLKPASFDTWKGAGQFIQSTPKHRENRFVALSHMTWLEDARVKRPRHRGCWHDPGRTISHNYLDSFLSSGSINSRALTLNTSWKQLRSEHLYMLFRICVRILLAGVNWVYRGLKGRGFSVQAPVRTEPGRCSASRGRCKDTLKAPPRCPRPRHRTLKCSHRALDQQECCQLPMAKKKRIHPVKCTNFNQVFCIVVVLPT